VNNEYFTVFEMDTLLFFLVFLLLSYLLGCISTGYYLVKFLTAKDIRTIGSTGTGATNVGRLLGKKGFIIVVVIDILKGILIALFCRYFKFDDGKCILSIIALASGHIWPVQLKFHGGKAIAVIMGFFFIWNFYMLLILGMVVLVSFLILKSFKMAGLIGVLVFPVFAIVRHFDLNVIFLLLFLDGIVYYVHIKNIKEFFNPILNKK
jgi:acyl phosphate:glycerol-3-phosphate acyltransferase